MFGLLFLLTCSDSKDSGNGDTTHKYSCTNGTAASGEAASENTEKCASCKDGYKLTDAKSCVATMYICTSGDAKTGTPGGSADVEFCTACKSGYKIASNQCLMTTTINGTPGDDLLNGTPGPNIINGLAGEDVLNGLAGDDVLNGGDGGDNLNGGAGADVLDGGAGSDTADYKNASVGVVVYLKAIDGSNEGEAAGDTYNNIENLSGSDHDDTLQGDDDPNTIVGLAGNDVLNGLAGDDVLNGGDGGDNLNGGAGADVLDGGAGSDTADYKNASVGVVVYLKATHGSNEGEAAGDTYNNIENLSGSDHDDTLQGDDDPNTIVGLAGNDVLDGLAGDDVLNGGDGGDNLHGGSGADVLDGGAGRDTLLGRHGNDTIQGGAGNDIINGGAGNDIMTGDGGDDVFKLETNHSEKDIVIDFNKGDKIGVDTTAGSESTLAALKTATEIDWVNTANHDTGTATNDSTANDTVIFDTQGTVDAADDVVIMVLEDYTGALVIGDFDVY